MCSHGWLHTARATILWQGQWHKYKPMKISMVNFLRVDVLLYILQSMIRRIRGNVITFLRTLWIWHWFSFGQHWTIVGAPGTTHSPLLRARSGQCPLTEPPSVGRGWYQHWPPVTLWISTVQQLDLPGRHPLVESKRLRICLNSWEQVWLYWYVVEEQEVCVFQEKGKL